MRNHLDYLIMLLSADWMASRWGDLGVDVSSKAEAEIRFGCREIVRQFIGEAKEYYLISFAPDRLKSSGDRLGQLVDKVRARGGFGSALNWWSGLTNEDEKAADLCDSVTGELLLGYGLEEGLPIDDDLGRSLSAFRPIYEEEMDYQNLQLASRSEWDKWLSGLTPALPCMLSDMLCGVRSAMRFRALWEKLATRLTHEQLQRLEAWYRQIARMRACRDLVPSWFTAADSKRLQ